MMARLTARHSWPPIELNGFTSRSPEQGKSLMLADPFEADLLEDATRGSIADLDLGDDEAGLAGAGPRKELAAPAFASDLGRDVDRDLAIAVVAARKPDDADRAARALGNEDLLIGMARVDIAFHPE